MTADGVFDPAVGAGTFEAEYVYGTLCTATGTVEVNVGEAVAAELEDLNYCESIGSVVLDDDGIAGTWTADCGGCVAILGSIQSTRTGHLHGQLHAGGRMWSREHGDHHRG